MENASKALLIAAAVLIVILLVAFGMRIFNTSSSSGDAQAASNQISSGINQASQAVSSGITSALEKTYK